MESIRSKMNDDVMGVRIRLSNAVEDRVKGDRPLGKVRNILSMSIQTGILRMMSGVIGVVKDGLDR